MPNIRTVSKLTRSGLVFYDNQTYETTMRGNGLTFYNDFLGACVVDGSIYWKTKDTGNETEALVSNGIGGVFALTMTSDSEKQTAGLCANDVLNFDITKGLIYEARVALSVLPTSGTKMTWGLGSAWSDDPDSTTYSAWFSAAGSTGGLINCQADDNSTDSSTASDLTVVASEYHIYRIDCSDVTKIRYYVDGDEKIASTTTPFAATGSSAQVQPYFTCYKASGTSVGTMYIDYIRIFQSRS